MQLLPLAKPQLELHPAVLEIDLQGNQGIALTHHKPVQLADFLPVHQELFRAKRITVEDVALFVGADVHPLHPDLTLTDLGPAFLQIDLAQADAFDLGAKERNAAFVAFFHKIVVKSLFIGGDHFDPLLMRHPGHPSLPGYYSIILFSFQSKFILVYWGRKRGGFRMDLHEMASSSRDAFYQLSVSPLSVRNQALLLLADKLGADSAVIFAANQADLAEAEAGGLSAPLLHRLRFGEEKLLQVQKGLRSLAALPDPLGHTVFCNEITEGLRLYRVTCPIGVLGIIFESRPDALIQIASLAVKSGNTVLLKGGREALRTNQALCRSVRAALASAGLPEDCAQLMETREDVSAMLREDALIDLIIPRGSNAFVRYIMDHSRIPVLGHSDGICHVYVDRAADPDIALRVAVDSKVQNVSVCNAMETLLVHESLAASFLPAFAARLQEAHPVRLLGDERARAMLGCEAATEEDWGTEYLDYILSIRVVDSLEEAIGHINRYGSHHTDCIVTEDREAASAFLSRVDSAGVYQNVSTRFADGFVYGFGAEVGIATGKLHARGPMGLDGLTTYKYKLLGSGQTMADMKAGRRSYTHRRLAEDCPL